ALAFLAAGALGLALGVHGDDFELQFGNPVADLAAIQFGGRFARPPAADAAALPSLRPGQLGRLAQARRHVAEAGDFDLRLGGAGARIAVENLEDDHGAVHHLAADLDFEIARLRRRNLMIDEDGVDFARAEAGGFDITGFVVHEVVNFLALADAQIGRRIEAGTLLDEGADDFEA